MTVAVSGGRGVSARWLSPELLLAAACAVWPPGEERTRRIRLAAGRPIDWNLFQRVVHRHGLIGLAGDGLSRVADLIPSAVQAAIAECARAEAGCNLARAAESVRLQRRLE